MLWNAPADGMLKLPKLSSFRRASNALVDENLILARSGYTTLPLVGTVEQKCTWLRRSCWLLTWASVACQLFLPACFFLSKSSELQVRWDSHLTSRHSHLGNIQIKRLQDRNRSISSREYLRDTLSNHIQELAEWVIPFQRINPAVSVLGQSLNL